MRASANLEKSDVDTPHPTPCTLHRVPSEYCLRTSRRVTWPTPMRQRRRAAATPANPAPITTTRLQQPTRLVSKSTICRRKVDCVDFFCFSTAVQDLPTETKNRKWNISNQKWDVNSSNSGRQRANQSTTTRLHTSVHVLQKIRNEARERERERDR